VERKPVKSSMAAVVLHRGTLPARAAGGGPGAITRVWLAPPGGDLAPGRAGAARIPE